MGKVLDFIPSEKGEREFTCIGSARLNHFTNSELRPIGTPDGPKGSRPTAFEAEPNHSHLLVLDDGTNWTAPGLELEFRVRLEALLINEFQNEEKEKEKELLADLREHATPSEGPAIKEETANTSACAQWRSQGGATGHLPPPPWAFGKF